MYKHLVWDKGIRGKIRGGSILSIIIFVILFPIYNHTQAEIGWSDRDRRSFTIMKEYGLYHFKKCWFKTHIVLFFPFWALYEKGSCVRYICIVWSILMINTSMASKEVRLLSKKRGYKRIKYWITEYYILFSSLGGNHLKKPLSPNSPTSPSY